MSEIPENKDAPCNICGRGWPYHIDACAYKATAKRLSEYEEILREMRAGYDEFYAGNNARLLNAESRIRNLDPPLR